MSIFRSIAVVSRGLHRSAVVTAHWNKDFKPGPYPKTEEERAAAASKYGLLREEYQPGPPDDGFYPGDYPHFKPYSFDSRDPFYPWDFPDQRRNYGEVLHEDHQLYTGTRWDVNEKPRYSLSVMFFSFTGAMLFFYGLMLLGENMHCPPVMAERPPQPGVKYYKYLESSK